jgi:uncharacterized protein (DUF58 family)
VPSPSVNKYTGYRSISSFLKKSMKIRWPVLIILFIALMLALAGGSTMMWRFFVFLVVLLAISYVWLRLSARQIEGRLKKTMKSARVGDYFEETFTVVNNGRLPVLSFEATEKTDLPGYRNQVKLSLPSWGSYTWHTRELCRRRGQYRVGILKAKIYDPLGLSYTVRELAEVEYVNVLPAVIDLPYFQVLPRPEPGLNTRRWFAGEPGLNASRIREYNSGDSLRHVHWRSTAHTGHLMVKEFDPDLTRTFYFTDVWIILDMQRETDLGDGEETIAEYGVIIASSLVKKYLDGGKKVGFLVYGDQPYLFLPDTGNLHEQKINQCLAAVKPSGEVRFEDLIISQEDRIADGSAVIVITPSDYQKLGKPLRRLSNRGSAVTAILLDAVSFGGKIAAADTSRSLATAGINVCIVKRGMEISKALDIRRLANSTQFPGAFKQS